MTNVTYGAAALAALLVFGAVALKTREPAGEATAFNGQFQRERLEIATAAGARAFDVEIASTPAEMAHGLMYRTRLADEAGMLFLHPVAREVRMWMRNTYIPLDMVFIRADGIIHRIAERTEPLSDTVIPSNGEVTAVLELAGGAAGRLGIKPGDKVHHRHFSAPGAGAGLGKGSP